MTTHEARWASLRVRVELAELCRRARAPDALPRVEEVSPMLRFNPAPGWPTPPPGWVPPAGWQPDPSWSPAPAGWPFWLPDGETPHTAGTPGAVPPNADGGPCPEAPIAQPAPPRTAEVARLTERHRAHAVVRVILIAPPVKGGLLGRIVAIGASTALGRSLNEAALDAGEADSDGAVRLPHTCLLCGLQPGTVTDSADITIDASTLGFFLGGELLSQQKVRVGFARCPGCAVKELRPLRPLVIQDYRKVGEAWLLSLLFLNDRVAEEARILNRARLITTRRCLRCSFTDDDQAWLAREDVCPVCHTLYAGGRAWLCPQCGKNLPYGLLSKPRVPKTRRQALWGGITCPRCGADVPKP